MFTFVQGLGYILPGCICNEHVDDLSHVLKHRIKAEIYNKAIEVGKAVKKGITELDLRLADKSVVTSNDKRLAEIIASNLQANHIPIKAAVAADDLGIETAACTRRCAKTANGRISKAKVRSKRIGQLAKIRSEAKLLGPSGTHKQQSYGHTAQGASKSQTQDMRRNLKRCTPQGDTQACLTSTLAWHFGAQQDPDISLKVEQVAQWIDDWQACDDHKRARLGIMWKRMLPKIGLNQDGMWNKAKGPVTATMCTLYAAGWKPLTPTRWLAKSGSIAIADGAAYANAHILAQLQEDIAANLWEQAEQHPNSTGLAGGADFQPARKAKASLLKEGNHAAARAIDFLVCGALHDPHIGSEGPRNEQLCHRCGLKVVATRKHELHECSANRQIDNPHIGKTNWVPGKALKQWDQWQCLYARGILPGSWVPKGDEVDYLTAKTWESGNFRKALDRAGMAHSDGSGGSKEIPQCIRKVAFGAVSFDIRHNGDDFSLEELACIGGEVPGRQTVPRAELWGAIQTLIRTDPSMDFDISIDAAYVTKGIINRGKLVSGPNGDLWSILFTIIESRGGSTDLVKVKSHLDEKGPKAIQNDRIRFDRLIGNTLADKVAGAAVIRAQPASEKISKANYSYKTIFCVAKRLAIIEAEVWRHKTEVGNIYDLDFKENVVQVDQAGVTQQWCDSIFKSGHRLSHTDKGTNA